MSTDRANALLVMSCTLAIATPAPAQILYSWEDRDGVHYTDDGSRVPKDPAVRVERRVLERAAARAPATEPVETGVSTPFRAAEPRPVALDSLRRQAEAGEPNERDWRDRFIAAHRRIQQLQASLEAMELNPPSQTLCMCVPLAAGAGASNVHPCVPARLPTGTAVEAPGAVTFGLRCGPSPEYERFRLRLAEKKVELGEAKLDLEQLDRRASLESVPREWRRGW